MIHRNQRRALQKLVAEIVSVTTAQVKMSTPEPLEVSLDLQRRIGLQNIIIVHDTHGPSGPVVQEVARRYRNRFKRLDVLKVTEVETAKRWLPGIRHAFSLGAAAVSVFPGDCVKRLNRSRSLDTFIDRCRKMLTLASRARLIVGDYKVKEPFKDRFDARLTRPLIAVLYPDVVDRLSTIKLTKMRSEFFVLGKDYFDEFVTMPFEWSADPTPQLLLAGLLAPKSLEMRTVHLGDWFCDDKSTRSRPSSRFYQMARLACTLITDKTRLEQRKDPQSGEQLLTYQQMRGQLSQVWTHLLKAIDEDAKERQGADHE
jgi:hypothetical protein